MKSVTKLVNENGGIRKSYMLRDMTKAMDTGEADVVFIEIVNEYSDINTMFRLVETSDMGVTHIVISKDAFKQEGVGSIKYVGTDDVMSSGDFLLRHDDLYVFINNVDFIDDSFQEYERNAHIVMEHFIDEEVLSSRRNIQLIYGIEKEGWTR